jgi:hypothetical protein
MKTKFLIPLLAGLALLCACKGKGGGYEVANNGSSAAADTTAADPSKMSQPKLVKTAGIRFKVKNVEQTAGRISALTASISGMVVHHQMASAAEGSKDIRISDDSVMRVTSLNTTAEMTVKIPSAKLEDFINQVGHMGIYVNDLSMDITDKSFDYLAAQLKLKSRSELIAQQKSGRITIKKPEDVLNLKDDMIDQQIGNRQIDDAVKNSVVSLSFYQSNIINKEVIANDNPSAYDLPFFRRLAMAVENGLGLFAAVIIGIANLWVFILAGFGAWLAIKYYKGRKAIDALKA